MANVPTTKTIIIHPGETIILPKDTEIDSLILDGSIEVTSTCNNLPDPSSYKCGYFYFILDVDDNEGHSMEETITLYQSVTVGTNTYLINELVVSGENPGTLTPVSTLNVHVPDQVVFTFTAVTRTVLSKRQGINLFFKVPEGLFNETYLKIDNFGSVQRYDPIEEDCDEYPTP